MRCRRSWKPARPYIWRLIILVLFSEVINLPVEQRDRYHRSQQAYVQEWGALLHRTRPRLGEPDGRILVHAALGLINDLTRARRLYERPELPTEIAGLARTVLDTAFP